MNTFDGYIRRDGTNSKVLLDGGDVKALSSFIGTLSYNNNKITYTKADGSKSYDLVDLSAYNLVVATSNNLGGIKIGFSQSGKNYPVQLDSNNKAYVYIPWEANSHYITNLYVGDGTAENKITTNGNTRIAVTDDNTVRNYITLIGSGATIVSSDNNGKITINSTNTTYDTGTSAILNTGTNTEGKLWSAKTLVDYISDILGVDSTAITSLNTLIDQLHDDDTATGILVELAKKLNAPSTSIGSNKQPIYWNGSAFTTIGYTIEKSVPSNAVFTDTKYSFYVGENNSTKEHKNVSDPYFKLFENNTPTSIQIKAGTGISVNSDANGNITIKNEAPDQNHDTHYTTSMYVGENNDTKANKAVNSPYFKLFDNNIRRSTLRFVAGTGIGIVSDANGNITITNNSPDQNHNTDKTGIKLGIISGTKKTDSTVIINNSSTGLTIAGGTNKFSIGDGTNYIEVPITPSFTVTSKDTTIGTSLTTIATIAGTDIKAKIDSYLPLNGGTLTGELISQNGGIWVQGGSSAGGNVGRMELVRGMPINLAFNTSKRGVRIYSNAIAFADPYNRNNSDSGWVRHIEEIANRGVLEIAVGDDGDEEIRFRKYNTSSKIISDVLVPNTTGTLALTSQIPTDNNQLTNGAGYLTSQYTTGLFIGKTGDKSNAATTNGSTYIKLFDNDTRRSNFKISGTQNVSVSSDANGNVTITGPDLSGLAITSNYYTKNEIDNKLSSILEIKIVTALPTSNINTKAIYLMSSTNTGTNDLYKEYVYINKGTESSPNWDWEILGEVKLNYSNLVTSIGISNQQLTWSKGGTAQTPVDIDAKTLLGYGVNHPFNGIACVGSDGIMEIGKYIDFHTSRVDTRDYAVRLVVNNDSGQYTQALPAKTGTIALTSDLSNYLPLSGGVISNGNWASQLTLKRNGGTPSLYFDDGTYKYWIYPQIGENKFELTFGNNTNGSNISKNVAFITDIPTKTSQLTNDSGYLVNAIRTYPGTDVDPSSTHSYWAAITSKSGITNNWWHILHMDWNGAANWRSELALPTQGRTGVYYRTDSGDGNNWTFNNWIKLLDTSNSYISNGTITINGTSITPLTSHQSLANCHPLNGKISISGGGYNWNAIQQYNSSDQNPSYFNASCAIINITSYGYSWQPWIRCTGSDKGSWALGNYTTNVHLIHFDKSNTGNGSGNQSWSWYGDGTFAMTYNNDWLTDATVQLGRKSTSVETNKAIIGVTNGDLAIDAYKNHGIYLNYYCSSGSVYFNGSTYYIKGGYYNGTSEWSRGATYLRHSTIGSANYVTNDSHWMKLGYLECTKFGHATLLVTSSFWGNQHGSADIIDIQNDYNTNGNKTTQSTVSRVWLGGSHERTFRYYNETNGNTLRIHFLVYVTGGNAYGNWQVSLLSNSGSTGTWVTEGTKNIATSTANNYTNVGYGGKINTANSASTAAVPVYQHTANDTAYPLVWSNQNHNQSVTENQLYKSWKNLYYVPATNRIHAGRFETGTNTTVIGGIATNWTDCWTDASSIKRPWYGLTFTGEAKNYATSLSGFFGVHIHTAGGTSGPITLGGRVYPSDWIQFENSDASAAYRGLYWPNTNNAAHFYPNNISKYATFVVRGKRGSFDGIYCGAAAGGLALMSIENSHQGLYTESIGQWLIYQNAASSDKRIGIGTSTLQSGYKVTLGGDTYVSGNNFSLNGSSSHTQYYCNAPTGYFAEYRLKSGSGTWEIATKDTDNSGRLGFWYRNEKMRLDTSGVLTLWNSIRISSINWVTMEVTRGDNGTSSVGGVDENGAYFAHVKSGSTTAYLYIKAGTGLTTNYSYYANSDIRLKNILSEPSYSSEQFANLSLVKYTWKESPEIVHLGSISQSVETIFPELITENEKGYKSLDYATLGAIGVISLAREIVELKKEINELKSKLYG